ncbi:unnamed protein product [Phytophthora fragariaefolia]|uniref:Unnamed protein product n=1 Tax=Phytophthora fragariaefolia TaxID=1490495 RepID=A0A9W6XGP1_9STRA|nr:unnamed protein product [Phytophthora fragariaefolia]
MASKQTPSRKLGPETGPPPTVPAAKREFQPIAELSPEFQVGHTTIWYVLTIAVYGTPALWRPSRGLYCMRTRRHGLPPAPPLRCCVRLEMNPPTATRREIAPLSVPWLQHEQFPATKQACSTPDGLVTGSKHALVKVVQELKRGRANVDKHLAQLDNQLLAITDYLDGKSANLFPPHLITYVEDTQASVAQPAAAGGRRHYGAGSAAVAGKFNGIVKSESAPPTPAMVEDDLNSGAWFSSGSG